MENGQHSKEEKYYVKLGISPTDILTQQDLDLNTNVKDNLEKNLIQIKDKCMSMILNSKETQIIQAIIITSMIHETLVLPILITKMREKVNLTRIAFQLKKLYMKQLQNDNNIEILMERDKNKSKKVTIDLVHPMSIERIPNDNGGPFLQISTFCDNKIRNLENFNF
uniref:Uncharacterized protein n=1 Tax=Glossina brevipalpis TaxID=37001 RepID=A0A1A9W515_9MUSC